MGALSPDGHQLGSPGVSASILVFQLDYQSYSPGEFQLQADCIYDDGSYIMWPEKGQNDFGLIYASWALPGVGIIIRQIPALGVKI